MPVTIREIAKKLNLSVAAVSRAMDGYPDISEKTRQRVVQTAREMGYVPNRAARQLRRQKADTIGFILPANATRFDEPFFLEFISGLGDALSDQNIDLLVANAKTEEMERTLYHHWLHSRKVDGIVLTRIQKKDWRVQFLCQENFPFTALGKSQDGQDYPHIHIDGSRGFEELVRHLSERGFSRMAFIGGHRNLISHLDRLRWFKAALIKQGLPYNEDLCLPSSMTSEGGYGIAKQLLSRRDPPDALVCVNDETAIGALRAAHELGLTIGREVGIAGFEGVVDSEYTEPPLTTLDLPVHDLAHQLMQMLIAIINGDNPSPRVIKVKPNLVIRGSTGG